MSEREALQSLETLLESFLAQAVAAKADRLSVLEGINNLDDIAKEEGHSAQRMAHIGDWLAQHSSWLSDQTLRPADKRRITKILEELRKNNQPQSSSPESEKIDSEIERWSSHLVKSAGGLVLKRAPEQGVDRHDSVAQFQRTLSKITELYQYTARSRQHLLSVLDESLKMAELQQNREALILSGFLLYFLRLGGYKVEPYVKRLKEAEKRMPEQKIDA